MNSLDHVQMIILCTPLAGIGVLLCEWDRLILPGLVLAFLCGPLALGSLLALVFHRWQRK